MTERPLIRPDWNRLYEYAVAQDGYLTAQQASEAGYSAQLIAHHVRSGNMERTRRGIYRLVHFPAGDHEDLAIIWLWSERAGVFSHRTALALHGLSDVLPARIHLTLPLAWKRRRFRVPPSVVLHHADVPESERAWFGAVPVTNAARSLNDCAAAGLSPDLLRQGAQQAIRRGIATQEKLAPVEAALAPFGGIAL